MISQHTKVANGKLIKLIKRAHHEVKVRMPDMEPMHRAIRSRVAKNRKTGRDLYHTKINNNDLRWLLGIVGEYFNLEEN